MKTLKRVLVIFVILCIMFMMGALLLFTSVRVAQPVVAAASLPPRQEPEQAASQALPLQDLLNPDGTLNLPQGQYGAIDPGGWQVVSGPGQAPRFAPFAPAPPTNTPGDENWASGFHVTDFDVFPNNYAVDGSGNVYAMGSFLYAGGARVNRVAMWNGSNWSAMGYGLDLSVWAMVFDSSGNAYATGAFNGICNDATCSTTTATPRHLAKWNGSSWSAEGDTGSVPSECWDIAIDSSDRLYLACSSTSSVLRLRRWDGSAWTSLGSFSGDVAAVVISGTVLYAGGQFQNIGVTRVNGVASTPISPTISWSAVGFGFNDAASKVVSDLAFDGSGNLYAGGSFTSYCLNDTNCVSTAPANRIAIFSAGSWAAMGSGLDNPPGENGLTGASGAGVYVGGSFSQAGGTTVNRLAYWNGLAWSGLGSGVNGDVIAVYRNGTSVYVGGNFNGLCDATACTTPTFVGYNAIWNGSSLSAFGGGSVGPGMNLAVNALVFDSSGNLYAGGGFVTAGETFANRVAKWNGTSWSVLGNGLNGTVNALALDGSGNLYAGGALTGICNDSVCSSSTPAAHIARWNGSSWSGLNSGFNTGNVNALAFRSGTLYVGGDFYVSDGAPGNYIATYNGSSWGTLGFGFDNSVRALAFDSSGNLYAGGLFTGICDDNDCDSPYPANRIAMWNGSSWGMVGNGLDDDVMALAVDSSSNLYAGGSFTAICDDNTCYYAPTTTNRIAVWNGASWSPVGNGVDYDAVQALALDSSGALYAGGDFTYICSNPDCTATTSANRLARWNGLGWSALGAGIDGTVNALGFQDNGKLYVGHWGNSSGGQAAEYIAQWTAATGVCGLSTGVTYTLYSDNLPVQAHVNTLGDLDCISAQRFNKDHLNASSYQQTGYYWAITGTNSSGGAATGFNVNLTLPYASADANDSLCRYTTSWYCTRTSNTANSVTSNNITQFSDWAVGNDAPTAVTLVSFTAAPQAGGIGLEWETASELALVGFNLYRSDAPEGVYTRLNDAPIAAKNPGGAGGAVYTWQDATVQPGVTYYYQLEAIELHGANMLGLVWATAPYRLWLPLIGH